ncbi:MAG: hypothetical protein NTW03_01725 [Verrucomicrobia bacterium]|nr:hypothetical protein [Verrucomicrobiota bacterium]
MQSTITETPQEHEAAQRIGSLPAWLTAACQGVAQVSNLLYRGYPTRQRAIMRTASRLAVGDTTDWKSALPSSVFALGVVWLASIAAAQAQWVAYNDHNRGANTAPFVSTYSLTKSGIVLVPAGGPLTNFATGGTITNAIGVVGVSISATGSVDSIAITTINPANYTPAGQIFNGKIDWNTSSIQFGNLAAWSTSSVTIAFTNLTPGRQYKFRATGGRSLNYTNRWTLASLAGASDATPAHLLATNSPGIVTNGWSPYGDTLTPRFQALWNSGINTCGDVVGWDDIMPINNSFSVICSNWTLSVPSPISGTNSASVFAFSAFSLEEIMQAMAIVSQPQDTVACADSTVSLSVGMTGTQPAYQWWVITNGATNLVANATNATLAVSIPDQPISYFVIVTNGISAVTSAVARLTLGNNPIQITGQPQNQTNVAGTTATFNLAVSTNTSQPISLQWYYSTDTNPNLANPIVGATNLALALSKVSSNQAGYYFALLTNCASVATSQVASLSVFYLPVQITTQPQSTNSLAGSTVTLRVAAAGSEPISYQWYKGSAPLSGGTNASLVLSNLQYFDSAYYQVVVGNPAPSSVASSNALLIVSVPPYNLVPISTYVWKYSQSGTNLGSNWMKVSYDDSAWPSGRSLLGHCATAYSGFANHPRLFTNTDLLLTNNGISTIAYYFRTVFVLTNDPVFVLLTTSNFYAHGIVVYLNGSEVYRMNMPAGAISYQTLSSSAMATNSSSTGVMWPTNIPLPISSSLLVRGTNTLAVECHKASSTSPDVYMGVSLTVSFLKPVQITNQPQSAVVEELRPVSFTVGYTGIVSSLQWYKQGGNGPVTIAGATSQTLTLARPIIGVDGGVYFAILSNVFGPVASDAATLTVTQAAPAIVSQPVSQMVCQGWPALFQVTAYGSAASTYQWRFQDSDIPQATNASLSLPSVSLNDAGSYSVLVSNALGHTTSSNAAMAVRPVPYPVFVAQPSNQIGNLSGTVRFSATMVSNDLCYVYFYQWQFNDVDLPGANSSVLILTDLQASNEGLYRVVVTNAAGSVTSAVAELTVNMVPLDGTFDPGASAAVYGLTMQADGKILVGGAFSTLGGQPRLALGRLNVDGTLDSGFDPGTGGTVCAMAVQTDGKILVGGNFSALGGQPRSNLGRINADGTLDSGFNPNAGNIGSTVYSLALQSDGKILVGGNFSSINGQPLTNLARLNTDGTLDSAFNPGVGGGSHTYVLALTVQPDGKILLGGSFIALGGQPRANIARLNEDGTLDGDFNPGADSIVRNMVLQADGKILVGGQFTILGGQPEICIARLKMDGTVDREFNSGADWPVRSISVQADGKIVVGGYFTALGGQPRNYLGRLNADGTLDDKFDPGANAAVSSLTLSPDGRILAGGEFTILAGEPRSHIARLNNTEPATQSLAYDGAAITWLRGGTSPEVWRTTFDQSTDGVNWTSLGAGTRVPGGWQLAGVVLSRGGLIRARGHLTSGYHNASSWFVETIAQPAWSVIAAGDGGFGIVSNQFGFNIRASGAQVVVETSTDLRSWMAVSTNTIVDGTSYFCDPDWTATPQRFYRARLWP